MARGINTINGIDYVYEYKSHWNAELRRSEQKRDYIGKIRNGEFVPNRIYKMRMELEALKRQNGLPSESDERPLEEELSELIRKHEEHKAKLSEKKAEEKGEAVEKTEAPAPAEEIAPEPVAEEIPEPEPVIEPALDEVIPEPAVEEKAKEEVSEPVIEEAPAPRKKHVLRHGELDDEEFGPDLFNVQPSVAPAEDEPEEEIVVEEIEEDEDPDLFAFSDEVEQFISDDEDEAPAAIEEPVEETPSVEEIAPEPVAAPVEDTVEPVLEETVEPAAEEPVEEKPSEEEKPARKARKARKSKDKVEEDNGQLFLF